MRFSAMLIAGMVFAAHQAALLQAGEPPAASLAFVSNDPKVLEARGLMDSGRFKEAEQLLDGEDADASTEALQARAEMTEIIRRTRREYSLDDPGEGIRARCHSGGRERVE